MPRLSDVRQIYETLQARMTGEDWIEILQKLDVLTIPSTPDGLPQPTMDSFQPGRSGLDCGGTPPDNATVRQC
jgi:hypothetical protein